MKAMSAQQNRWMKNNIWDSENGHTYYLDSKYSVDNECEHILRSSKAEKIHLQFL